MSYEDLCWKCQEEHKIWNKLALKSAHCHHPKEKEKCWCEYPSEIKYASIVISFPNDEHGPKEIKYCPVCGKRL